MLVRAGLYRWQGSPLCRHQCNHYPRSNRAPHTSVSSPVLQWRGLKVGGLRTHQSRLVVHHSWTSGPQADYTDSEDSSVDVQAESFNLGLVYGEKTASRDAQVHPENSESLHGNTDRDEATFVADDFSLPSSEVRSNGYAYINHTTDLVKEVSKLGIEEGEGDLYIVDELASTLKVAENMDEGIAHQGALSHDLEVDPLAAAAVTESRIEDATSDETLALEGSESTRVLKDVTVIPGQVTCGGQAALQTRPEMAAKVDVNHESGDHSTESVVPEHVNGYVVEMGSSLQVQGGLDDLQYYTPVSGHRVVGVVVSGNHAMLDVDIGAAKLGFLHVKELLPIDKIDVEGLQWKIPGEVNRDGEEGRFVPPSDGRPYFVSDEEVLSYEEPTPLTIDVGTVLDMEVMGNAFSGNPLLSVRRAARRVAWERVRQIQEQNEPIEVEVVECNEIGVIARIEGVRAFLPLLELVKQPNRKLGESPKDIVGRRLWVIITVAEEVRGNLIISERQGWARRNLSPGTLLEGTVVQIFPFGARVQVNGTDVSGLIHISNIARALVRQVSDVFQVGEQVKMIAVTSPVPEKISFSTADLESEKGLMLRDKERVFREAEETAKSFREANQKWKRVPEVIADKTSYVRPQKPIANLDWLDFGEFTAA